MFSQNTIRKEIMAVVDAKIDAAEKEYKEATAALDTNLTNQIAQLQQANLQEKEAAKQRIVKSVLEKVL